MNKAKQFANRATTRRFRVIGKVLIAGLVFATSACQRQSTEMLINEAVLLAKEGGSRNWDLALAKVKECIKRGVTDRQVINFYLICLNRCGQSEEALAIALEQYSSSSEEFMANYIIGKLYLEKRQYREALRYLKVCHDLQPDDINTTVLLANAGVRVDPELAARMYSELKNIDSFRQSYLVYNGLGVSNALNGNFTYALSHFSKALALSPSHPIVYLNLAVCNDRYLNKPKIAVRYYHQFLMNADTSYLQQTQTVRKRLAELERRAN